MLKKLHYILILILFSFVTQNSTTDKFEQAVVNQDHVKISGLCDSFVEIETVNTDKVTSKRQVGTVIREFFATYPLKSFEYIHKGTSPGGAQYAIGTYTSQQNKHFRVVIKMKTVNNQLLLESIKFSPE